MRIDADIAQALGIDVIARVIIQPGVNQDGYWTSADIAKQLSTTVIPIFNILHPDCEAVFVFDNSTNHSTYSPDALITKNLNIKDGGAAWETENLPRRKRLTPLRDTQYTSKLAIFDMASFY
jgi:hypothetical protein